MDQSSFKAVYMRGGTSRALFFKQDDLPERAKWDPIFAAALGSPDPHGRQLDGMGGGISSLSKIAVIGPPTRPDADVDYTFAQVLIDSTLVQYKGNCGNISAAVGPFAVDEGMVEAGGGDNAVVRIHNTNTGKIIVARFGLAGDKAAVDGDFELKGVAGTGAPIRLSFLAPGGAVTGMLLPTGRAREMLNVEGVGLVEVSMVDAANPVVMLRADALGLRGDEAPAAMDADKALIARCEAVRRAAAVTMGIARDLTDATERVRSLPLVALVSESTQPGAHVRVRMFSSGQPHRATPLTGGMCVAAALHLPGTIAQTIAQTTGRAPDGEDVVVEHASGVLRVGARVRGQGTDLEVVETAVYRTARRLMDGHVYVPASRLR